MARPRFHNNTAKTAFASCNFVFLPPNMTLMKQLKLITILVALGLVMPLFAQDGVGIGQWRTHLPYQKVIAVEPVGEKVYAATAYELFYYDKQDNSNS